MQLLRAVEGTGLHLCHYRRADFAVYVTIHSYPNDIHVLSADTNYMSCMYI